MRNSIQIWEYEFELQQIGLMVSLCYESRLNPGKREIRLRMDDFKVLVAWLAAMDRYKLVAEL